ncbi:hypothetical protein WA026_021819, partial [Henosepilachna vigintioctopunctata]
AKMPRNRVRKTSIGLHTAEQMSNALKLISDGQKIRAVARSTDISFSCSIKPPTIPDPTATASGSSSINFKKAFLSPFQFRGLPKASPRKSGRAPRRRGK